MLLEEVVESFLLSRKNGTSGAKGLARAKTIKNYEWGLSHFLHFMQETKGRSNYESITRSDIRQFLNWLKAKPGFKSQATYYGVLRGVRAFMHFIDKDPECQESGLKGHSDLLGAIPRGSTRPTIPTLEELKAFRSRFDTKTFFGLRNYAVFSLLMGTGLRNGELRALKVEDVHLKDAILHVPAEGKTGTRLVPLDTAVIGVLKAWLRRRGMMRQAAKSSWLFPGKNGEQMKETGINQVFNKLQRHTPRDKRITPHTLRHVFGTLYLANNGSMERCRMILGHTSYDTLKIYLHMGQVDNAEAKLELERVSPLKTLNSSR